MILQVFVFSFCLQVVTTPRSPSTAFLSFFLSLSLSPSFHYLLEPFLPFLLGVARAGADLFFYCGGRKKKKRRRIFFLF